MLCVWCWPCHAMIRIHVVVGLDVWVKRKMAGKETFWDMLFPITNKIRSQ